MKPYTLSVIEFALPSPRVGSIDTYSGFGITSKQAIKKHQEIQLAKQKEDANYQAEVRITNTFAYQRKRFQVSGRMDGVYIGEDFIIEEIKTGFDTHKLSNVLKDTFYTHPFWLQLQTYGYMHWLNTDKIPTLQLLLVSLRKDKSQLLSLPFDIQRYEAWLATRLEELHNDTLEAKKRISRRKKTSQILVFPFEAPRPHQNELIDAITTQLTKKRPMLIQAPTGLGKTIGVLYPTLKESLSRGQKTIYLTPKNSQHQIALDTIEILQEKGAPFKSLILTAKKKLCMKNEPICNAKFCEFAENHFTKLTEHGLLNKVQKKKNVSAPYFKKMAKTYKVCPYELQMQSIPFFDVVVGDYNYVFGPNSNNSRVSAIAIGENEKTNLILDEVHNLPARGMDYYSPALAADFFHKIKQALDKYPNLFKFKLNSMLDECIRIITECALPNTKTPHLIDPPTRHFKKQNEILNEFLTEYLESDLVIEEEDPILRMCNYWSDFTDALEFVEQENGAFFASYNPMQPAIKITCCDASSLLKEAYSNFEQIVGFSATLKPFDYYSQLIGLRTEGLHTQEFLSPFSQAQRKMMIIPQISTKYKNRAHHSLKIKEAVLRIAALKPGNYFIFFPSFEFLELVYLQFTSLSSFTLLKQTRKMPQSDVTNLLSKLHLKEKHHLVFAVQGGMFAEGIDYIGNLAIGAFIVGPPLPMFDWEREQMKHYYETHYQTGEEYSYIYPAMAKAVQAAGRVIRNESDKGIIILMDNRFLLSNYSKCMPTDWFKEDPRELISTSILKDISNFWD
jgi:DNA excision repair protein ERCC-2